MLTQLQARNTSVLEILISNDLFQVLRSIFAVIFAIGALLTICYLVLSRTAFAKDLRKRMVRRIWALQIWSCTLLVSLVIGLIKMRGEPLLHSLIGIAVNLLFQAGTLAALRNQKMELRNLDSSTAANVTSTIQQT